MKVGDIIRYVGVDEKDVGLILSVSPGGKPIVLWASDGLKAYFCPGELRRFPNNFKLIKCS